MSGDKPSCTSYLPAVGRHLWSPLLPVLGAGVSWACIWVHAVRRNHGNPNCRYPPSGAGASSQPAVMMLRKPPLATHQVFWKPAQTDSSWLPPGGDHRWMPSPSRRKTDGTQGPADKTAGLPHQSACSSESVSCHPGPGM